MLQQLMLDKYTRIKEAYFQLFPAKGVKLPQPQLRTRKYTQTGQSTLRATQVRAALSHAYAVTYQNRITDKP
jgi:hypothetical protein